MINTFAKRWVTESTSNDIEYALFSINNHIIEVPKEYLFNDRARTTIMQTIVKYNEININNGKVISLRGGITEEKEFRTYLRYLRGSVFCEKKLTVKKMARTISILLQFGVGINSSVKLLGLNEETCEEIIAYFLAMLNTKTLNLIMIMDIERSWKGLLENAFGTLSFYYGEAMLSNIQVLEGLGRFYDNLDLIHAYLSEMSQKEMNPKQLIDLEQVFCPSKENISETKIILGGGRHFDEGFERRKSNLAASIPKKASKITTFIGDDLKKFIIVQLGIESWLVRSMFVFKKMKTRQMVIEEWKTTEFNLCENMKILKEYFKDPMQQLVIDKTIDGFGNKEYNTLFSTLNECIDCSQQMVNEMNKILTPQNMKCDFTFGKYADQWVVLARYLLPYTTDYNYAKAVFDKIKQSEEGKQFIDDCQQNIFIKKNTRPSFEDLLIQPVQRLMRYPLLLKEIIKNTGPRHPDQPFLKTAFTHFNYFSNLVNELGKKRDELKYVSQLLGDETIFVNNRYMYSEAMVTYKKKHCYAFLFSDELVFAKEQAVQENKPLIAANKATKKVKIEALICINDKTEVMLSSNVLNIKIDDVSCLLSFDSIEKCKEWSQTISKNITYGWWDLNRSDCWVAQMRDADSVE
ncbi:Rho guanine nucleotide exchange factor, putative [Entamoeba histolytica HM-1:IMSS-B]|uniref:Rho guanine nucleotide exchange factor, putative n=6 Tax=Entamoeba histolytica TaxID=5759 RepID=C4M737_ENTH1|nr:Rho guanine nucleotide exchange factor, putative [Entamoeba histolytica HM-1:IMSS]EMD49656.1 rho/RAC guanine nucleotide exchange factor, putative [Entamoeba histolytica KU27]EMH75272.1 Rho guanine nucleotide exchange factor, putative [Entamoeba histolytica HM-1:IMSS-B]EMS13536.1 Rho/RAC guanine nucleotide exchange factor, putative [Entamoeba histolytica HM-3:IMSS]ENY66024.1 Rho/RAC guanine nucleotide exchange factor, putative [Entamoeba histolytica HM-1:IMSS-A]GAT97329.1 rho guanine nucleot|eukprot:XP_654318.1 Rho guanine nucleotide exchange factor, putative [Entamoeba histolytica HM-1:IMSS]